MVAHGYWPTRSARRVRESVIGLIHPNAQLDDKRKAIIRKALGFGYGREPLCQAISGCSYTPHNMGKNDHGQRYDGLHVIPLNVTPIICVGSPNEKTAKMVMSAPHRC